MHMHERIRAYSRAHTHTHAYIHYICICIYIYIYMFVVNSDALAQASDFLIERRQVVFPCRMQVSNPEGLWNRISSRLNAHWQTDWAIENQTKKIELDSPSLWSTSIQPTRPHCQLTFALDSGDIHIHTHIQAHTHTYIYTHKLCKIILQKYPDECRQYFCHWLHRMLFVWQISL